MTMDQLEATFVGVIGCDLKGAAIAGHLVRSGRRVMIASWPDEGVVRDVAKALGPTAQVCSVEHAGTAELVVLSVAHTQLPEIGSRLGDWSGRTVIDTTRIAPAAHDDAAWTARHLRGASVVKAFNVLPAEVVAEPPEQIGGRRVVFLSGDDRDANRAAAEVVRRCGFAPVVLGALPSSSRLLAPGGYLDGVGLFRERRVIRRGRRPNG
jgi:8-hydroxy-5-deazaflavin:NADPH oxidoreductase